ncbi:hypothetical protein ACFE04_031213 [Oxalis oulophora]
MGIVILVDFSAPVQRPFLNLVKQPLTLELVTESWFGFVYFGALVVLYFENWRFWCSEPMMYAMLSFCFEIITIQRCLRNFLLSLSGLSILCYGMASIYASLS